MCEIANAKFSRANLMLMLKSWSRYWGTKCLVSCVQLLLFARVGAAAGGGRGRWWPRETGNRKGEVRARLCFCLEKAKHRQCLRFWHLRCAFLTFRFSTVLIAFSFVCHLLGCSPVFCRGRKLLGVALKPHSIDSSPSFGIPGRRQPVTKLIKADQNDCLR